MKSKSIRTYAISKLNASILGACLTAGLSLAAVTPAHAVIYNPYAGYIPYTYTDDNGSTVSDVAFRVRSNTSNRGWIDGLGTISEMASLRAVEFTQLRDSPKICAQVRKSGASWSTPQEQCTTSKNSTITVGAENSSAIQVMNVRLKDCAYNDNLTANAMSAMSTWYDSCGLFSCTRIYNNSLDWQEAMTGQTCSQKIKLGIPVSHAYAPPYMTALDLKITRNDNNCATCSSSSAPVGGGLFRPIGQ
jgi:hypothetical protein